MSLRVFIVEDNEAVRHDLTYFIQMLTGTLTVDWADDEKSAIDWLEAYRSSWQLAIVDLHLNQGNGFKVLQACRLREPHQKVVVLSTHLDQDTREVCRELGADAAFDKAFQIRQFASYLTAFSKV